MVKTNIQTFSGEVEILSNLHVGSYLTANGAASNVLDITGNVGATFFVGDGGFLSNIATTLSDIVNQGNVVSNVVTFEGNTNYAGVGLVTSSNVGIQNTNPLHTLSIGDKIRVNNNTDESLGESVIEVDGRILATRFEGDGGLLSNIATTLESIVNQGNVSANVVKFSSNALVSEFAGAGLVTDSNVGIQNTAPTYNLSVGSNLHVNDTGSNVLTVHGNVVASNLNLGVFSITPAYGLNEVCNTSNGTTNVVQFQNGTTSLVASSNITASGNITAQTIISGSNVEIADRLKFTGNVFIDTLRVADVAANLVTYDRVTGELTDSGGTFLNKFAIVSEQPPSDFFANTTTVTNHGSYTLTTSNLATNSNTYNAFDGTANAWVSGDLAGGYIGGANVFHENNLTQLSNLHPTQFGDWLAIEFPYKTTLRHMKLTPLTAAQFPASANIYATNNDLTWTEINYWKDVNPVTASNVQTITVNATEQFKKYALVATKAAGNSSNVAIQDWQLFTESFSIDGGKVAMAQQAATGGETVMDQHGPHGRGVAPLKKYPEIEFQYGKLDANETTFTYTQAGYTVKGTNSNTGQTSGPGPGRTPWKAFSDLNDGGQWQPTGFSHDTGNNGSADNVAAAPVFGPDDTKGAWVSLELPKKIKLQSVYVKSVDPSSSTENVRIGKLYGSNNNSDWVTIKDDYTLTYSGSDANDTVNSTTAYKYIVFQVRATGGSTQVQVYKIRYYGYEEDPPLGDTSVDTSFTSIMNTPQTTGAQVYVDGNLGETFTNRVVGPTVSNTHTTYVSAEKYWELSGNVESNVTLEANTFLSGDAPHSLSMWFKSSNLVSNASNSCIFSLGTEERLDHVSAAFSNNYQTVQKLLASDLEGNDRFGKDVAMNSDGTKVIVSAYLEHAGGTSDAGSAYIYTYNGVSWVEHKLVSPDNETSAQFGTSVSMSSDGMKVIVGAMHDDEGATDTGAAYIFTYSGGSWDAGTKIVAPDKAQDDRFGNSVGMSGDGTKVIVGAYIEDEDVAGGTTLTSAGSAYIFTYNGSSWDTGTKIVASDRAGSDLFGRSVAMNSDGTKAIVGAEGGEAAYIFTYNGSSWVEQQILVASDADAGDKFGFDVAMSGDGTKVIVGAYLEHAGNLSDAGAAYIYTYNGSSWDTGTKIVAPDKEAGDRFGYNVGMSSDGTGVIVGAYLEHAGVLTDTGSAYIYTYDGSNWDTGLKISAPVGDRTANDQFGSSVAMNSDGKKVIVGALLADPNSLSSAGFAHVFTRDTTHHLTTDLKLQSNTWHNLTYAYQGEGGSRVTYLDGRKVAEDQAEDTFGLYPPFDMSGYSQGGYVASASSENTGQGTAPGRVSYKAFNNLTDTNLGVFQTSTGYTSGGTATVDAALFEGALGHWVKLELPTKIKLGYVSVQSAAGSGERVETAKIFGSNDDINWEVIKDTHTLTYIGAVSSYSANSTKYFKYLLFQILSTFSGTVAQLFKLQYYGHRENDLVRLPDPTNVLKYPHIAMTGPAQRGYVASASSNYSTSLREYGAFTPAGTGTGQSWLSSTSNYSSVNGTYTASPQKQHHTGSGYGEWLQIEMPHKIQVTKFILQGRPEAANSNQGLYSCFKTGQIWGSEDGTTWVEVVSSVNFGTFTPSTLTEQYTITVNSASSYKYFAIIVTSTNAQNTNAGLTYAGIGEWQIYGTEEATPVPIQIGGGNIDKVANFRVYDKFIGEDQALEIWDAQKDTFRGVKNSMTLQKGRLGIGTTEPEGRLAVLDEPDATTYGLQEFPPKPLAGYKTYFEGHGEFCASASVDSSPTFYPSYVFDQNRSSIFYWDAPLAARYSSVSPGNYLLSNRLAAETQLGEYLVLKLPYKIKLEHFTIQRQLGGWWLPQEIYYYAKSEYEDTWEQIYYHGSIFGSYSTSGNSTDGSDAPIRRDVNSNKFYRYFALVITKGNGGGGVSLADWRLFGYREQVTKQSVLHDGQLTLTKNLIVPRIGPALDADDTPRRDRLVVEYNTSTNPTFEGAVRDTSGRGLDGVLVGASYDTNEKALEFDGSNDYVRGRINNTGGDYIHSVSWWFKTDITTTAISTNEQTMWHLGDAWSAAICSYASFYANRIYLAWNTYNINCATTNIKQLQWNHACVTYTGGGSSLTSRKFYLNGHLEPAVLDNAAGTLLNLPANTLLTLGSRKPDGTYFNGTLSNFKLYDTALTAEEVKTLYDMGRCDEGHHVVNFSKTRVGIGLGDGEAPTYTLDVRGQIRSQGSLVTSFTGQHKCIPDEPMEKGLIVSAKKNQFVKLNGLAIGKSAITIDESLPIVSLSNVAQDKACFGVVSSIEEANTTFRVETTNGGVISTIPKTLGDNRAIVNSVGEGAIWVVDTNGSLESGDYITTSNVVGYGQKQDDDILHNYTVAKITMDCDFTGSNVAVQTIKREETGLRTIMEDTWNQLVDYDRSSNTETQYSNTLAPSAYTDQPGYTPREVTTIVDYTDGSNIVSIAEWSNLESNIQNTYQSNTFTEIVDYTKFVNLSEWSNLTTDVQNTYSEAEITTYYQIQRGENVLDENGQLQFEDKTGATEAPYERRFLDASGAQTDSANAVHIAAFVGCTYHCG
jgi:hypothetical protein